MPSRKVTFLLTANAQQFKKTLASAQYRLKAFGRKTERLGRSVATLAAPLAIAGAASVKMASDFQASMTKIQTLVGLSAESVQGMRKDVLDLAKQTGRGPKELADALFVVTSAGLRGAQAMNTLERAAKASAIGLGETKDIARALTGILQSYSKQGLTAAEATDTLIGVIREGNLEASELAPVLGRVTGIASQLGISFSQVGASIASFTRLGVGAEEAVTGLRGIMNALLKQTPKARRALDSVGLTFDGLRDKIEKQGLARALVDLTKSFKGNEQGLAAFAGRVRGLAAIMGTAGAQTESYLRIADDLQESTGNLDKGFATVSKTVQFKFQKAFARLKVEAVKLGTVLFPMAIKLIDYISDWVKWFGELSDQTKKNIFWWTKWTLILGGSLIILGKLSIALSSIVGVMKGLVVFVPKLIVGFQSIGAAAGLAATEGIWAAVTALTAFEGLLLATGIGAIVIGLAAIGTSAFKSYQQTQKLHDLLENLDAANLKRVNAAIEEVQKRLNRNMGFGLMDKILGNTAHFKKEFDLLIEKKHQLMGNIEIPVNIALTPGQTLDDMGLSMLGLQDNKGPFIFKPKVKIEPVVETGGGISDAVKDILDGLQKQLQQIKIKSSFPELFPNLKEKLATVTAFKDKLRDLALQGLDRTSAAYKKVNTRFQTYLQSIQDGLPTINKIKNVSVSDMAEGYAKDLGKMAKATGALSTVAEAALGDTSNIWTKFVDDFKVTGEAFQTFLVDKIGGAITKLSANIGKNLAGIGSKFKTAFEQIMQIVADFAIALGELLIAIGTAMAFTGILSGPGGLYILAGAALVAAGTGVSSGIDKRAKNREGRSSSVNDALIRSDGSIVKFHPDDNILAMKDFSNLIPSMPGMGGGMPSMGGFSGDQNIRVFGEFVQRGPDMVATINTAQRGKLR